MSIYEEQNKNNLLQLAVILTIVRSVRVKMTQMSSYYVGFNFEIFFCIALFIYLIIYMLIQEVTVIMITFVQ